MSVPPTIGLKKGWNMLGYTAMKDTSWHSYDQIKQYLISIRHLGESILYFYDACSTDGWIRLHSGGQHYTWSWGDNSWPTGWGAWFWAQADDR
jgi:hypothetical protein